MITILDYGMGNLGSIHNMFKKIGVASEIVATADQVRAAHALVLPGVGKFDSAMRSLESKGVLEALNDAASRRRIPILGICLGMQLMTRGSEEGVLPGLGWFDADTRRLTGTGLRVPHMGWNTVRIRKTSALFDAADTVTEQRFYFVHSFAIACRAQSDVLTTTSYGGDFVSAFERDNLVGVQFHPEKSHKFGMNLLRRFAAACAGVRRDDAVEPALQQ